jgi:hypothetical protein
MPPPGIVAFGSVSDLEIRLNRPAKFRGIFFSKYWLSRAGSLVEGRAGRFLPEIHYPIQPLQFS